MTSDTQLAKAIVTYPPGPGLNWKIEDVTLSPLKEDEVLVDVVASGVCHTDFIFSMIPGAAGGYPRVLGHEGSGYVVEVGSKIKVVKVGDPVLLSFTSCSTCKDCHSGNPAFCAEFGLRNFGGKPNSFQGDATQIGGQFFGQSSFASKTIVHESSIVNVSGLVKDREDLKLFSPFGCGFQTGAGAITNFAGATDKDTVTILGLGGVGLSSIMAAKIKGCKTIIGVDRVAGRLALATELGASHVFNTSDANFNLVEEVRKVTEGQGTSITVDATGNAGVIKDGLELTARRGQMILVGAPPPDAVLNVHLVTMLQSGKSLRGCIEGDVIPEKYIKEMIQWYRDGKLPVEKLVKYYKADDFKVALADMETGATVKPILLW